MTRALHRTRDDARLGGVCAGLGAYFGIDPTLVRVLVVSAVVLSFPVGLVAYLVLWAVVPVADRPAPQVTPRATTTG